jgi:hypothetical protein
MVRFGARSCREVTVPLGWRWSLAALTRIATIVLKPAKSTRSPDFGEQVGLRVAFVDRRLVLGD